MNKPLKLPVFTFDQPLDDLPLPSAEDDAENERFLRELGLDEAAGYFYNERKDNK